MSMRKAALLALPLLLVMSLTACKSINLPFLGPGAFALDIAADRPDEIVSLFVIVGAKGDLRPADDRKTISDVVHPDKHDDYEGIGQFAPEQDGADWVWVQRRVEVSGGAPITMEVERGLIHVKVSRKLLTTQPELEVVVVANCGRLGWTAEKFTTLELENLDAMTIEVRGENLRRASQ